MGYPTLVVNSRHQPAKKSVVQISLLRLRPAAVKGVATLLLHVALHRNLLYLGSDRPEGTQRVVGLQSPGPAMTD